MQGPEFPDAVGYLYDWACLMVGRSGASVNGLAPLSYETIDAWARLTDHHPRPHEVAALIALDDAMRNPEGGED